MSKHNVPDATVKVEAGTRVSWLHSNGEVWNGTIIAPWGPGRLVEIKADNSQVCIIGDWILRDPV